MYDPQLLKERFGIPYLRPYQELIISRIMECAENGKNARILAVMPTGSGKSLCFMYPAAALERRCIIIYPLLSLMNDQEKKVRLLIDEDVLTKPYFACHPCINTSSLRFDMKDLEKKIIPALEHEPTIVKL